MYRHSYGRSNKRSTGRAEGAISYQITRMEAVTVYGREEVRYVRQATFGDEPDEAKREADRLQREWNAAGKAGDFIVDMRQRINGRWEVIDDAWYAAKG